MARVLHGISINSLPEPGTVKDTDKMVAYRTEDGVAYSTDVGSLVLGDFVDKIYPVGSIYMSLNDNNPGNLFGGQWEQIENCFLLAAGSNHGAGSTGGQESVALTSSEIPSHTHSLPSHTHSTPSHTHSIPSLSGTAASAGSHQHGIYYERDASITSGSSPRYVSGGSDISNASTSTGSAGSHTHSVTTNSSTTGSSSGTTGGTSGTSGSTGSGSAHDNMPPYLAVYMWQRTA